MNAQIKQFESDMKRVAEDISKLSYLMPDQNRERFNELMEEWQKFKNNADSFIWVIS